MSKLKVVEILVNAIAALVAAVKSTVKFIDYIVKLRNKPATSAA